MSLKDIRSECAETAGLLQPYVDGELSEAEQEQVAVHLRSCSPCRSAVHEQHWVRTVLSSIEREPAPQALRARILLDLDAVDREQAASEPSGWGRRVWSRMRDLSRGGLVMVPAGAMAVALFFLARQGMLPGTQPEDEGEMVGAQLGTAAEATKDDEILQALAALEPQVGFPVQVARPRPEAEGHVELVSARLGHRGRALGGRAARLEYRILDRGHPTGRRVVDLQMPADGTPPQGTRQVFRGQTYYLTRDARGRPWVRFRVDGVAHVLSLEGEGRLPGPPEGPELHGQPPDFAVLLATGDVLRRQTRR